MKKKMSFANGIEYVVFFAPAVVLILFSSTIPIIMNFPYSFTDWNGLSTVINFVGFDNFVRLFTSDPSYWIYLSFTLRFVVAFVICANIISLALAAILYRNNRINNIVRVSALLPFVVGSITVGLIWRSIYTLGFPSIASMTGMELFNRGWLSDLNLVFISILITALWQNIGFYLLLYIAGLAAIPNELIEAAYIDGASPVKAFFKIKLPLLTSSVSLCLFLSIIFAIRIFDTVLMLTRGGPGGATTSLALDIYFTAFDYFKYGYGTAKAIVFTILVWVVTGAQLLIMRRLEVQR